MTTTSTVTSLDSTGSLDNEYPGEPSTTYECRMFRHTIKRTEADDFVKTISWELEGNIPVQLTINEDGVIEGHVDILDYQPACKDQVSSHEKMKIDGSNWNAGRFQGTVFTFDMVVKWTFEYMLTPLGGTTDSATKPTTPNTNTNNNSTTTKPKTEIKTLATNVSLDVYLDNDITNLVFCRRYLEAEQSIIPSSIPGEADMIMKHYFTLNGKVYTIKEFQQYIQDHPGPFGKCKV